jgi:hypothetical protein
MPEHKRGEENEVDTDAHFMPVDGLSGQCKCGALFNYIAFEGATECDECGRVYNVYVSFEEWDS